MRIFYLFLLFAMPACVFSQNTPLHFIPKLSEHIKDKQFNLYFSEYLVNDTIEVFTMEDKYIRKVIFNHAKVQLESFDKEFGNLKIKSVGSIDRNPAKTVKFKVKGSLDNQGKEYYLTKWNYLIVHVNQSLLDTIPEEKNIEFKLNNPNLEKFTVNVRHDDFKEAKDRKDVITINGKTYTIETKSTKPDCEFKIDLKQRNFLDIEFEESKEKKNNKSAKEKYIYLVINIRGAGTIDDGSQTVKLYKNKKMRYKIFIKNK